MNDIRNLFPDRMRERTFQLKAKRDAGAVWHEPQFVECKQCGRRAARTLVVPEGGRAELERLVAVAALLRHHRARRHRQVHAPAEDRHRERGSESAHGGQRHGELHRV